MAYFCAMVKFTITRLLYGLILPDLKEIMMKKCRVCKEKTEVVFNIDFKATSICEKCATAIFIQQATWYTKQRQNLPIPDVSKNEVAVCPRCGTKLGKTRDGRYCLNSNCSYIDFG